MKIKIYDSFNQDLKKIWNDCYARSNATIFQDYDWMFHWYEIFCGSLKTRLCATVIFKKNAPIAILPLCINSRKYFNILEWVGVGVSDYQQPIIKNTENISKNEYDIIFKKILKDKKGIDLIHLNNITKSFDNKHNCFIKHFECKKISTSYEIFINKSYSEFIKENKSISKQVKELQRQENNLNKTNKIIYIEYTDLKTRFLATEEMISLKEKQYEKTGVKNIFKDARFRNFYLGLLNYNQLKQKIHISSLLLNQKIIAIHFGLKDKTKYYYLMPAYNDDWRKSSPGGILMNKIIKQSFSSDIDKFDFLPGDEKYKIRWSNSNQDIYEYISPKSLKGFLFFVLIGIKKILKRSIYLKKITYFLRILSNKYNKFK